MTIRVGLVFSLALVLLASCASSPEAKSARSMEAGKKLLEKNDASRAILQFQNAVRATPKNAEAYYLLSTALVAAGDGNDAVAPLRKALELKPDYKAAQLLMARLMASTSDPRVLQDAESRLESMLKEHPEDPDALQTLAFAELKLGKSEDAMRQWTLASLAAPQDLSIAASLAQIKLQSGDSKGAEQVLQQACQKSPRSVAAVVLLAKLYSAENRPEEAEQQFQHALSMDPKDAGALYGLGLLQMALGKKQEAERTFFTLSRMPNKEVQTVFAAFLAQEGRNKEVVQELERLMKEDPDDRRLRTLLVKTLALDHRASEADKLLRDVLKKNPKDASALLQQGELALDSGNLTQAESNLNQVIHMQATSAEAHYVLGKLYLARKEELRYRQELAEVLKLSPGLLAVRLELAQSFINAKNASAALALLSPPSVPDPPSLPVLVERNWAYWSMQNFSDMRKGIDKGLAVQRSPDLLVQDGLWKLHNGDAKGARSSMEEALKIDPADLRALLGLSQSYGLEKNTKAAVQRVREFAASQPKSAPIQDFLGMVLLGTGDQANRAEARRAFMAAKSADPHFEKADLALVQLDALEGKLGDARKRLEGVLDSNGSNITARVWLGNIAEVTGDHKTAIDQFRKAVAGNPNDAQAFNNLAYLLTEYDNNLDEALKSAQRAVELVPDRPAYCDTLGWALYRKGLYSSAIPYLQRASADPQDVVWKYHLAMAYAKAGDLKNGRTMLNSALKINPKVREAKLAQEVFQDSH